MIKYFTKISILIIFLAIAGIILSQKQTVLEVQSDHLCGSNKGGLGETCRAPENCALPICDNGLICESGTCVNQSYCPNPKDCLVCVCDGSNGSDTRCKNYNAAFPNNYECRDNCTTVNCDSPQATLSDTTCGQVDFLNNGSYCGVKQQNCYNIHNGVNCAPATPTPTPTPSPTPTAASTPTPTPSPTLAPKSWWQVRDGDVLAGGDLQSLIPLSCSGFGACNPVFNLNGNNFPGIPIYSGPNYDFREGASFGQASNPYNWLAKASYLGKSYYYSYFENISPQVECKDVANPSTDFCYYRITDSEIQPGTLNSLGAPSRGYVWLKKTGNLGINNGKVNLVDDRKIILMIKEGNLEIEARINLQHPGVGFFMAIVGNNAAGTKGDINIEDELPPNDSGQSDVPELEGLYVADSEFYTGKSKYQLWIRGSVIVWDRIVLERDLSNTITSRPAELFEYAPALIFTFPRDFFKQSIVWKETAP